jgi:transcriptional regulator with XRE-family HTH domain
LTSQHAFGSRLRTQRERRGVALAAIADRTKLKLSLLEALERGDLSQWPKGLFRRAYLREYAAGAGINADALLLEVEQLFPEDGDPVPVAQPANQAEPMRLSFPSAPALAGHRAMGSALAAGLEWLAVAAVGLAAGALSGLGFLTGCGLVALVYYPVSMAITGRTLSMPRARMVLNRLVARPQTQPELAEQPPLYLVNRPSQPPVHPPLGSAAPAQVTMVAVHAAEEVSAHAQPSTVS